MQARSIGRCRVWNPSSQVREASHEDPKRPSSDGLVRHCDGLQRLRQRAAQRRWRAARRAGLPRILTLDMGGTSTDVARWEGEFIYQFEQRLGSSLDGWRRARRTLTDHLCRRLNCGHIAVGRLITARTRAHIENGSGVAQCGIDVRGNARIGLAQIGVIDADGVVVSQSSGSSYSNPTKVAASATDFRGGTTALDGKSMSGQPSAMLFMIT